MAKLIILIILLSEFTFVLLGLLGLVFGAVGGALGETGKWKIFDTIWRYSIPVFIVGAAVLMLTALVIAWITLLSFAE